MRKVFVPGATFLLFCSTAFAVVAVKGKAEKLDSAPKTILVKG